MLKPINEIICPCCFQKVKPDIIHFSKKMEAYRCTNCGIAFAK